MGADILVGLEGSALAAGLRQSTWLYPLVNAGHIVGLALLFGAIVPLDLRLLGLWRDVPLTTLLRVLVPVSAAGLAVAATAGLLLFMTDARDYAASGYFQAKMALLGLGLANAGLFRLLRRRGAAEGRGKGLPLVGAASLGIWLAVIVFGRLIGYF